MIRLSQLFGHLQARISPALRSQSVQLRQVTTDSRAAAPDSIFFSVQGTKIDGHSFVDELLRKGVLACVVQSSFEGADPRLIRVDDPREALGWAMSKLHGDPSLSMKMVGVTGTSGKTTTTYLIERILQQAGHHVGVIGTVNFRVGSDILPSTHTTPGSPELQALLADMKTRGCTAVVMEVSSHALKQHRTAGIAFDAVVFNNLSPEHLDFHPSMEDYFESKKLLFTRYPDDALRAEKQCVSIINADDPYGRRLLKEHRASSLVSFGMDSLDANLSGRSLILGMDGIRGELRLESGSVIPVNSSLLARFNAYNLMAAAGAALSLGIPLEQVASGVSGSPVVPGRLEPVPNRSGLVVLVDYAHKPDALEKVLLTLRELRQGSQRIVTVVGCGGDRDRTKRPVMGRLAAEFSDLAVITSDNPRTEDPGKIIEEIVAGIPTELSSRVRVEQDRAKAIHQAIAAARPGDLVLIAGKGHEDYQILGTTKIHFDDREVAAEACRIQEAVRLKS